jgi:hypothetical protein
VSDSGFDNTDLHHLRPADCNVNSARNNRYFGQCGTVSPLNECVMPAHPEAASDTERDAETFLPPMNQRGDIARSIFYMDLRYDGDEVNTLDLVVSDCPASIADGAGMGYLSQLLQWHIDDPVDDAERKRNEDICNSWQGNRNPFVDYPELVEVYFGVPKALPVNGEGYDCTVTTAPTSRPTDAPENGLIITGVIDGPRTGGVPKAIELYALNDIPDLSLYGVGFANNGGGSNGVEFAFPYGSSAAAGSFITVSYESVEFAAYFGVPPDYVSGFANINGDDAIELFFNGQVVDVFGAVTVDGTGTAWEYMDGWAYRNDASRPSVTFQLGEWTFSGVNALDACSSNAGCASAFPFETFQA